MSTVKTVLHHAKGSLSPLADAPAKGLEVGLEVGLEAGLAAGLEVGLGAGLEGSRVVIRGSSFSISVTILSAKARLIKSPADPSIKETNK